MFASKSLSEHLLRGALGVAALALSWVLSTEHPLLALPFVPLALVALRGCPMCWTLGLVQTFVTKVSGRSSGRACVDGSCVKRTTSHPA